VNGVGSLFVGVEPCNRVGWGHARGAGAFGLESTKSTCQRLPAPSKWVMATPSRCTAMELPGPTRTFRRQ
jgi:hypothetical protein